jgi:ElaB/YqjD/DUF883 family membrane-anchored ribosome-binding protein
MAEATMEKVSDQIAHSAQRISKAAETFADVLDEGIGVAKRAVKHSGDALEELMDDNTQRIKRHPLETVAITFTIGISVGILFGLLIKRR